jgi:hypothetical protein
MAVQELRVSLVAAQTLRSRAKRLREAFIGRLSAFRRATLSFVQGFLT